jgi:hypothetical protein
VRLMCKQKFSWWVGKVSQVVQHLPSKCKALSSHPNTTPTPRKEEEVVMAKCSVPQGELKEE